MKKLFLIAALLVPGAALADEEPGLTVAGCETRAVKSETDGHTLYRVLVNPTCMSRTTGGVPSSRLALGDELGDWTRPDDCDKKY